MNGLILKPFRMDALDQSFNICSIFDRNENKYNLFLKVQCCFIFPFKDSQPLLREGTFAAAPSYL